MVTIMETIMETTMVTIKWHLLKLLKVQTLSKVTEEMMRSLNPFHLLIFPMLRRGQMDRGVSTR